jgi:two-component system, sensor histidine kinase and response regulator
MRLLLKQQSNNAQSLTSTATPQHYRLALVVSTMLILIALFILPNARLALIKVPAFLPSYATLASSADLLTAYLLFGQFMSTRMLALGVLAATYYYSSLVVIAYILTFPGVFSPTGLLDANAQTAIWLFVCWHTGFPCGIFAYMLLDQRYGTRHLSLRQAHALLLFFVICVPLLVVLLALVAIDPSSRILLPILIEHNVYTSNFTFGFGLVAGMMTFLAGLSILLRLRRLTVIQLWLGVTILATFLDLVLNIYANSRYTVGWYLARSNSLWASIFVLGALLYEVNALYAKLMHQNTQLDEQNAELEKKNYRQKQILSVVSHEFRGALSIIGSYCDLLLDNEYSPEEIKKFTKVIQNNARRITRLINDMLDLDRMESGQMQFMFERVDLNTLIEEAVAQARLTIPHQIHLRLDRALPFLNGDSDKLTQVVINLLNNACKYSPNGETIVVCSEQLDNGIHFSIQDHGIGIPQDKLEQVFEQYYRVASNTTRNIQGTGLGLSIVREIIHKHGGKIWVESQLGAGSIFHVMLPFAAKISQVTEMT